MHFFFIILRNSIQFEKFPFIQNPKFMNWEENEGIELNKTRLVTCSCFFFINIFTEGVLIQSVSCLWWVFCVKVRPAVKGGVPVVATCCRKTETRTERSPRLPGYMWLQGRTGLPLTAQNTDSNSLLSPQYYRQFNDFTYFSPLTRDGARPDVDRLGFISNSPKWPPILNYLMSWHIYV